MYSIVYSSTNVHGLRYTYTGAVGEFAGVWIVVS